MAGGRWAATNGFFTTDASGSRALTCRICWVMNKTGTLSFERIRSTAIQLDGRGDQVRRLGLGAGHRLLLRRRHRDRRVAGVPQGILDHEGREYLWLDDQSAHHSL
jgi:hypothetical protein